MSDGAFTVLQHRETVVWSDVPRRPLSGHVSGGLILRLSLYPCASHVDRLSNFLKRDGCVSRGHTLTAATRRGPPMAQGHAHLGELRLLLAELCCDCAASNTSSRISSPPRPSASTVSIGSALPGGCWPSVSASRSRRLRPMTRWMSVRRSIEPRVPRVRRTFTRRIRARSAARRSCCGTLAFRRLKHLRSAGAGRRVTFCHPRRTAAYRCSS